MSTKNYPLFFRHVFRTLLAGGLTFGFVSAGAGECAAPLNPSGFVIKRGVNLSHWLSQDFGWFPRSQLVTPNDLKYIASIGYDHVRLPIDEIELWHEDGKPNEEAFALMEKAIGWSRNNNLRVIVDLHTVRSHHFNAENEGLQNTLWTDGAAQEHFLGLWRELSSRLSHHPVDWVAYEIMNEPVADDPEDWNRLVARSMEVIRSLEPDRVVVIGSNRWQIPQTLPLLKVPAGDPNIILSTHTYAPLIFTHYLANWTPLKDYTGPVTYPGLPIPAEALKALRLSEHRGVSELATDAGDVWNKDRIAEGLRPAIERAKELGLQLYCGEFGCLPTVPREDRLAYYRDIVAVFEENGMAWANWEYKGDFGLFEWFMEGPAYGAPDVELIDALLGQANSK
jgi:endoglucanase